MIRYEKRGAGRRGGMGGACCVHERRDMKAESMSRGDARAWPVGNAATGRLHCVGGVGDGSRGKDTYTSTGIAVVVQGSTSWGAARAREGPTPFMVVAAGTQCKFNARTV